MLYRAVVMRRWSYSFVVLRHILNSLMMDDMVMMMMMMIDDD